MDFSVMPWTISSNRAAKTLCLVAGSVPVTLFDVRHVKVQQVGSAAQHSQSLESWFTHIPGLKVVTFQVYN